MALSNRLQTVVASALLSAGCATLGGLEHVEGEGSVSYYRAEPGPVFDASVIALSDLGLRIARFDEEAGHVAAEAGGGLWSYGEVIGVFVRPSSRDSDVCAVQVVSRKRLATNVLAKNWEADVLERVDAQLPTQALLADRTELGPPSTISRAELHECLESARRAGRIVDSRVRDRELRECREEGAGDSEATSACLRNREAARTLAGKMDMEVLNACLHEERKKTP